MTKSSEMKALKIKVFGRVQKVGYRNFIFEKAIELSIKGKVENHADGTVYLEAIGTNMQLDELLEWCYKGSPISKVERIEVEPLVSKTSYSEFIINRLVL